MKYIYLLIIIIIIKLSTSDFKAGQKELQKFEKKAKALACSFLSKSFLSSIKDAGQKLKEILQKNNIINNESEAKDKISQFMLVNCYTKISSDISNKIILDISKGNIDFKKNKKYLELFEMDSKTDFNKLANAMKEVNDILKEIKAEEEMFNKRKKDDPNFEKNLKDFEEKMKKNYEQKKNEKKKSDNVKYTTNKKKKGSGKKPYEGTKWEIVNSSEESLVSLKDIILNPTKFFDVTGLNTICGMIIMALITIYMFQIIYDLKNKDIKEKENEEKINEDEINEVNNENNDNEDDEDEKEGNEEENNINKNINNINNEIEKLKENNNKKIELIKNI